MACFSAAADGGTLTRAAEVVHPKRIAVIVSNRTYPLPQDRLTGTFRDAATIESALTERGFGGLNGAATPTMRQDVKRSELRSLAKQLGDELKKAGASAIGFLYYAGHGTSDGTQNYLLPVDVPDVRDPNLKAGVALNDLVDDLFAAQNATEPTIILVVDACRTSTKGTSAGAAGVSRPRAAGLTPDQPHGLLIALSSGAGESATDSGEYARALAKALGTPGLTIANIFEQAKLEVSQSSHGVQNPIFQSGIRQKVCLGSCQESAPSDPRELLAKRGVLWTVDAFFDAIRRGDLPTIQLFIAGRMATNMSDTQGRTLPVILSLNETNADKVIDLLARSGVDLNARYEVWAPMGPHKKTILERSIEHPNLLVVKALLARKVRLDEPMQTFGGMGVTINTYPLAATIYWEHLDFTKAFLDAGADPRSGNYAAYRQAQETSRKTPALVREIQALLPRLAPPADERARMDAQPQQAVNQCVRRILATPPNQLLDEATHFNVFSNLTLGPRECVLAKANASLVVGDRTVYRADFFPTQAQRCCEQAFGVRR